MLKLFYHKELTEAGCDEAGRGCLAGPVYAAAVILPKDLNKKLLTGLNDSKQMNEELRYELRPVIQEVALAWCVASASHQEIDEINILNASFLAMHRALDGLSLAPKHIIIDGNRFKKYRDIPHQCVIEGDGKYLSIAAASVLAKTYRDDHMKELHEKFPVYNWKRNKAYATPEHRKAIEDHGLCEFHRRSFRLVPDQLELEF
ncbi:MAG: ribonuclease HII [Bacteroidota bacterium]